MMHLMKIKVCIMMLTFIYYFFWLDILLDLFSLYLLDPVIFMFLLL
jgi:hypothetical protein